MADQVVSKEGTPAKEAAGKATLTETDNKFLVGVMKHLTGDITFNADGMVEEFGYKNAATVRARWNQIKKKLVDAGGTSPSGVIKRRSPKKKAGAKDDKAIDSAMDEDDGAENGNAPTKPTPKKRARKPKAEKAEDAETVVKQEQDSGDAEDEAE